MGILLIAMQEDLDTIGLKYLHYYLLKHGHHSTILYLPSYGRNRNNEKYKKEIEKFVRALNPGLIGISLMSTEYFDACFLTSFLKKTVPSIPTVWGGIHPTIMPRKCLDYVDYVCIGEGERTILEMANAIDNKKTVKDINNLCYLKNGSIQRNTLNPVIENLDKLPCYEQIPMNSYILTKGIMCKLNKNTFKAYTRHRGKLYSVITTRGCPFSCTYCCNNFLSRLYNTRKIRRRSIENVIEELEQAIRQNPEIEYINFQDDCFLASSKEYIEEFCDSYKKRIGTPFVIRSIPTYVTRAKLTTLKKSGLSWISLGLQSGSDRVCREIYKRPSLSVDFLRAAKIVKEFNIAALYDIITDNPFETEEDSLETINVLMKTPKPFYLQFFSLVLYQGTELYEKAQSECPKCIEDSLKKDYLIMHKTTINNLIRLAAYLKPEWIRKAVGFYKTDSKIKFKLIVFTLFLLNVFLFEPVTCFRLIKLSQKGSIMRTFKVLSMYFKTGIKRYVAQFKAGNPSSFLAR